MIMARAYTRLGGWAARGADPPLLAVPQTCRTSGRIRVNQMLPYRSVPNDITWFLGDTQQELPAFWRVVRQMFFRFSKDVGDASLVDQDFRCLASHQC
jgi:hypothetical protein